MQSLQLDKYKFEVHVFSDAFVILKNSSLDAAINSQLAKLILDKNFSFVKEVIASEDEIVIALQNAPKVDLSQFSDIKLASQSKPGKWVIPFYPITDSDWEIIVQHTGIDTQEYLNLFLDTEFTMQMTGFLPGFPYLTGLPASMHCPRKSIPSTRITQGSIAVGGPYVGIYPFDSPGGWNVIGRTPLNLIEDGKLPPTILCPNDAIQFELIDEAKFNSLKAKGLSIHGYNQH